VELRTTALSITVDPIVSVLNNQGRMALTMTNLGAAVFGTNAPFGLDTIRENEYVVYSSIAGCAGHRASYHDSSEADE